MESKFKVGDKVLLNKPKERGVEDFIWISSMDKFDGEVFVVKERGGRGGRYHCTNDETAFFLPESWLTKVGEQVTEQVAEQVSNPIAWEQRRWDLYKMFLMHYSQYSIEEALITADRCVEFYKQKKQN